MAVRTLDFSVESPHAAVEAAENTEAAGAEVEANTEAAAVTIVVVAVITIAVQALAAGVRTRRLSAPTKMTRIQQVITPMEDGKMVLTRGNGVMLHVEMSTTSICSPVSEEAADSLWRAKILYQRTQNVQLHCE